MEEETIIIEETESADQLPSKEERNWATFAHLSALAGFMFPLANIWGPLIIWLLKRDESAFVEQEARESLNFQISLFIYGLVSALLLIVAIGVLLIPAVMIFGVVNVILATLKANEGKHFEYPLCIRLIK